MSKVSLHSWIEIDLSAIRYNIGFLRQTSHARNKQFLLMVKANGYGHGAAKVAIIAQELGASFVGVAHAEEALELRDTGVTGPILLFAEPLSSAELTLLKQFRITPTISSYTTLSKLAPDIARLGMPFHLKFNTGLNRFGFDAHEVEALFACLQNHSLTPEGLITHYSSATDNHERTKRELSEFQKLLTLFQDAGHAPTYIHASNSAATVWLPEDATNLVRLGLATYGLQPSRARQMKIRSALTWKTRIVAIKSLKKGDTLGYGKQWKASSPMTMAIISIGYSDGFRRSPYTQQYVLCRGKQAPVLGSPMMSHSFIDVTAIANKIEVGDEVVIIGKQGREHISAELIAEQQQTTNEEVLTAISSRINRKYTE